MRISFKTRRENLRFSFYNSIAHIIQDRDFQQTKNLRQHGWGSRYDHLMRVSWASYRLCSLLGLDREAAARGGLLHDYYLYDSAAVPGHWKNHPAAALALAQLSFPLKEKEVDIIISHMWPLSPIMPKSPEAYIVSAVDTISACLEYGSALFFRHPPRSFPGKRGSLESNQDSPSPPTIGAYLHSQS